MTHQGSLFDTGARGHLEPHRKSAKVAATSVDAYREFKPADLTRRQTSVMGMISDAGSYGATDEELAEMLGWPINCLTPRRGELEAKGLIRDSGLRRLGRNCNAKPARVWVVA